MLSEKHIIKYMKTAKLMAEEGNSCKSRHVGAVVVDPITNAMVSVGYNGPPSGSPDCDSIEYLTMLWQLLIGYDDKERLVSEVLSIDPLNLDHPEDIEQYREQTLQQAKGCGKCPRRLLGCESGKRLELCSCAHAEANALVNASKTNSKTYGAYMFAWCGVPCIECSKLIVNAGIQKIFCLKSEEPDYSPQSRWLFNQSNVELIELEINESQ